MARPEPRGVKVPTELHTAPHRVLEEYVRARLLQFAPALGARVSVDPQLVQQAAFDALSALPPPDYSGAPIETRDLQLVFRHDCQSLGCLDSQCVLCEHNPHRRCSVNFAPKYLVNDILRAKCEASIRVEVIDRATGQPLGEDIPGYAVELCILDGNQYDQRCADAPGEERSEDLDACSLLLNNKATALLVSGPGGSQSTDNKVVVSLAKGTAVLPDLHVSDSSEALLSGRKPPFRLLARVVRTNPRAPAVPVRSAVSEGFVVATRRTRTAGKVEIPNVDDHVGKLEHMGRETVKKLQDIRGSAMGAGIDIQVPDNCINKVGEFRKLALLAEADGHLRQKLQQVLKLSKEKWEEARDHAMRAVVADNRMRIWYADKGNMDVGLLFTCRLGTIELDRPVGLLTKKASDGAQTTMEATLMAQQTPAQRDQVRALQPQSASTWWQHGHPGWAIYPVDSESFLSTGTLDQSTLPSYEPNLPLPSAGPSAGGGNPAAGGVPGLLPGFGSFMAPGEGGLSNDALLRALGMSALPGTAGLPNAFLPGMGGMFPPGSPLMGAMPPPAGGGGESGTMQQQQQDVDASNGDAEGATGNTPFAFMPPHHQQQQQQEQQRNGNNAAANGGAYGHEGHHSDVSAFQASAEHHKNQNGNNAAAASPTGAAAAAGGGTHHGTTHITSAFASVSQARSMEVAPSLNLGNLQNLLGPDFKLPFSMSAFPSLPSGDLEAMLAAHGGDLPIGQGSRLPSLMLGRLTSVELGLGTGTGTSGPFAQGGGRSGAGGAGHAVDVKRQHSGLESMQSIDQALPTPENPHAAMDAAIAGLHQPISNADGQRKTGSLAGSKRK